MLQIYLKAENMKYKRSLFQKLAIVIPVVLILTSMVFMYIGMGLGGFSSVMVCNWSMPIAALSVVFMCHLVNNKEKKHQYHTLYSLPIDLKKTFVSCRVSYPGLLPIMGISLMADSVLFIFGTKNGICRFDDHQSDCQCSKRAVSLPDTFVLDLSIQLAGQIYGYGLWRIDKRIVG